MANERFLGIDFSGGSAPWRPRCARPTVWIAAVEQGVLVDLRPVQNLPGDGQPFNRLVSLFQAGQFRAAGMDAPFALPASHMPPDSPRGGGHRALLKAVARMPPADDRPFPRGEALMRFAETIAPLPPAKLFRETETACGALARSTLWNGARPGAPFTVACLTLLARAGRPVWPWSDADGMMVEAFPMAQLKSWGLRYKGYGLPDQSAERAEIVAGVAARLKLPAKVRALMTDSPDALDAVVAAFGAMAAASGNLAHPLPKSWKREGAIAVHA